MGYKRIFYPKKIFEGDDLDSAFTAIGTAQGSEFNTINPNIEDTLFSGSLESVNRNNGRIASILVDWISAYHELINVDRLTSIITSLKDEEHKWVKVFWCANAQRLDKKYLRWKKLASLYPRSNRFNFIDRKKRPNDQGSTEFLMNRYGEDDRFIETCIRIPKNTFQHRPTHVFSADKIAKIHGGFKQRLIIGPTCRADMWAALTKDPTLSPSELADKTYGSYATAHRVKWAYQMVKRDYSDRKRS